VQRRPKTEATEANQQMDIGQQSAPKYGSITGPNRNTKCIQNSSKPFKIPINIKLKISLAMRTFL
jgi:hypothetical protein